MENWVMQKKKKKRKTSAIALYNTEKLYEDSQFV